MTSMTALFGCALPIVQAPMAGVQGAALANAVIEAGGVGSLPAAMLTRDALRAELEALRSRARGPYNVNFFCHQPPPRDDVRERAWRELLAPYHRELGVEPAAPAANARVPFDAAACDVLAAFRPPIVSFHFGLPPPPLLARVKSWGTKILSSANTPEEAHWLVAAGVDAVIAQGVEAGGHRGMFLHDDLSTQMGTLALVRRLVRELRVPVIAAGGIADKAAVDGALALGAAGVQVGTSYLLCAEATTSPIHRRALTSADAAHTAITNVLTGRPARGIVNRVMRELGPMNPSAPAFPVAAAMLAPLRAEAERRGSADFSPLWAGQDTGGCAPISAAELTRRLAGL